MTNENNYSNELVSDDDDPTAELEALTVRQMPEIKSSAYWEAEADANTFDYDGSGFDDSVSVADLKSDLKTRSETIERLQFDVTQLHAKWLGLEAELKAREEVADNLAEDLGTAERNLTSKSRLLRDRDRVISSLKAEIRERDQRFRELRQSADELETSNAELVALREASGVHRQLDKQAGEIAAGNARVREIERQQQRTEAYADQLRRRLDDALEDRDQARRESDSFAIDAKQAARKIENLAADLDRSKSAEQAGLDKLTKAQRAHEQEVRLLRFELGEATDTLSERENLSEQLAADLLDSRGYRDELERVLSETADRSQTYIEDLERQVQKLENTVEDNERKLDAKSEAITCLLAELSRKSHEVDSIEEMEDVIQEIDDRISERIDDRPAGSEDKTNAERVTRLLIGRIDDQELRFPLFKDRLTIGRAGNNDIQLKGQHISRRHAVVLNEGNTTRVIDWGSKNGVYVNSERVTEHFLKNGDLVAIGKAEFRYEERPKRDI